MHHDKPPSPDGMTPGFYQEHWKIVDPDVIHTVKEFVDKGTNPKGLNETIVVLVPNKKCPTKMTKLQYVSLCNILVKLITKVTVNKMKGLLESIISKNQSAFIPDRLISDNIMISYDDMHYLKREERGINDFISLKLDMSKAFERNEWKYVKAILLQIDFNEIWVHLILQHVNTVSY
ncbi:hypothetical protein AgCh_003079 [Apium graveolens]